MYGAAATLYTLLTGSSPDKMGRSSFLWPPQGEATLDKAERTEWKRLHDVIRRATEEKASARFVDFRTMAGALSGETTKAQPSSPPQLTLPIADSGELSNNAVTGETGGRCQIPYIGIKIIGLSIATVIALVSMSYYLFIYPTDGLIKASSTVRARLLDNMKAIVQNHAYDGAELKKSITARMELACFVEGGFSNSKHDAQCQALIGVCELFGCGSGKQDDSKALEWFQLSERQGNAMGQFYLGWCYWLGKGVARDPQEAVKWFRISAENGSSSGQFFMGRFYHLGILGFPQDDAEAVKWWKKSTHGGDCEAYAQLGYCYQNGVGVPKDEGQARVFCTCAEMLGWKKHAGEREW